MNFSSQLLSQLQCVSPIIYWSVCKQFRVIVSSETYQIQSLLDANCDNQVNRGLDIFWTRLITNRPTILISLHPFNALGPVVQN